MLSLPLVRRNASTLAVVAAFALVPFALLRAAIASAAGLVLEASLFAALAAAFDAAVRSRQRRSSVPLGALAAALGGCGCTELPGALSIPALGLACITFGPVALLRFAAGAALAWLLCRRKRHGEARASDPFDQLAAIVPYAICGSLLAQTVLARSQTLHAPPVIAFLAGAALGAFSPCSVGAVALAATLRAAPWACAGVLCTASFLPTWTVGWLPDWRSRARPVAGVFFLVTLAAAARGGAALVHPRLILPALGAAAFLLWRSPERAPRVSSLAPLVVAAALVLGSPAPRYTGDATSFDGAYAGRAAHFTGVVERQGEVSLVVRYAITCCRADAFPVALRLERPSSLPPGTWVTVDGTFVERDGTLQVQAERMRAEVAPVDPFLYR